MRCRLGAVHFKWCALEHSLLLITSGSGGTQFLTSLLLGGIGVGCGGTVIGRNRYANPIIKQITTTQLFADGLMMPFASSNPTQVEHRACNHKASKNIRLDPILCPKNF